MGDADEVTCRKLLERTEQLCASLGWTCNLQPSESVLLFWPWGDGTPPMRAVATVLLDHYQPKVRVPYVLLALTGGAAPRIIVERHLFEMQKICRRYAITLTTADIAQQADAAAWIRTTLSSVMVDRALSAVCLKEAMWLLQAAQWELAELCRQNA